MTMLLFAVAALIMPAIYALVAGGGLPPSTSSSSISAATPRSFSVGVAVILGISYLAGLLFLARTHCDVFNLPMRSRRRGLRLERPTLDPDARDRRCGGRACPEVLVGSILRGVGADRAQQFFVGIIVVAVVGNAAEHWLRWPSPARTRWTSRSTSRSARRRRSRFVAPILVLLSFVIGPEPMALVFNGFELGGSDRRRADRRLRDPGGRVELVRGVRSWPSTRYSPSPSCTPDGSRPPGCELRRDPRGGAAVHQRGRVGGQQARHRRGGDRQHPGGGRHGDAGDPDPDRRDYRRRRGVRRRRDRGDHRRPVPARDRGDGAGRGLGAAVQGPARAGHQPPRPRPDPRSRSGLLPDLLRRRDPHRRRRAEEVHIPLAIVLVLAYAGYARNPSEAAARCRRRRRSGCCTWTARPATIRQGRRSSSS